MKKILLLILLLFISKTYSQIEEVLSKKNIIKHKIEEIQIFDVSPSKNSLFMHNYYDHLGNLLKEVTFNKDGTIQIKRTYQYNEEQQLVSSLNEMDNKISITKYKDGKVISSDSTIVDHQKKIFNEKNQIIKIFWKKENSDELYLRENRFYNDDGLESKRENFRKPEKLFSIEEFVYDKNQNLIFLYTTIDGKKNTTKYLYNKKGELTKLENSSGKYTKFKYDRFGNKIKEIWYYNNDTISLERDFKYDKFGNRIEEKVYQPNHQVFQYRKYKYKIFE